MGSTSGGEVGCLASAPDLTTPPSSTRKGTLVTTVGPGPGFALPQAFVDWHSEFGNNLHLTRAELQAVRFGIGEWDAEYAEVLADVLDFDRCAAHVGGEGWGAEAGSYGDLQVRVYVIGEAPAEFVARVETTTWGKIEPTLEIVEGAPWTRVVLNYYNLYGDYGGDAFVDLRLRRFAGATVVLAGMHADFADAAAQFEAIVDSVCWGAGDGECCPDE